MKIGDLAPERSERLLLCAAKPRWSMRRAARAPDAQSVMPVGLVSARFVKSDRRSHLRPADVS